MRPIMFSAGISSSPSTGQNHFSRHLSFAARIHPKTDEIFKVENYRRSDKIDQSIRRKLRNKPYYEIPRYKENHDGNEPSTSFLVTGRTKEDMDRIFQQEEEMLNETVHRSVKRLEELDHSSAVNEIETFWKKLPKSTKKRRTITPPRATRVKRRRRLNLNG